MPDSGEFLETKAPEAEAEVTESEAQHAVDTDLGEAVSDVITPVAVGDARLLRQEAEFRESCCEGPIPGGYFRTIEDKCRHS